MMISEATPFSHPFNFNDIQRVHPLSASPGNSSFFRTTSPVQSSSTMDDVTTIFVVGFPEDMAEREFQNMFIFCQGFEAASLKWHCKDGEEESIPSNGGKKQMIGFARFRTRLEALEAIEVLSGKKIDQEKGTVLKAEMAKKNLHIKRGSATQTSTSTSSSTCSTTITPAPSSIQPSAINELKSRYDSFSPLPTDLLSQDLYDSSSFNDSLFGIRSQSFDQDLGFISSRAFSLHHQHPSQLQQQQQQQQHPIHHQHQQQQQQQHQHPIQHQHQHPIQQQQYNNNNDPYHYLSKSTPVDRFDSVLEHDLMRMGSLSINTSSMDLRSPSISSPTTTTTTTTTSTSLLANRLPNPADQNPPCNTLYVGNLPPNTSEEELRLVFSNCKGYRRMCFRTKPQGPMCFVEFEDIVFASQALNELQGHNLTNSVKGGIRLSYSKNPLFIKPTSSSGNKENGLMSFKQMGNALLNRDYMFDPQL